MHHTSPLQADQSQGVWVREAGIEPGPRITVSSLLPICHTLPPLQADQCDQKLIRQEEYHDECNQQVYYQSPKQCFWKYMETTKVWQMDKWMDDPIPKSHSNSTAQLC